MKEEEIDKIKDLMKSFLSYEEPPEPKLSRVSFTTIFDLNKYALRYPISVLIEYDPDDSVVALWPDVEICGYGENVFDAIEALKENISTLADDLLAEPDDTLDEISKAWRRSLKLAIKSLITESDKPTQPISVDEAATQWADRMRGTELGVSSASIHQIEHSIREKYLEEENFSDLEEWDPTGPFDIEEDGDSDDGDLIHFEPFLRQVEEEPELTVEELAGYLYKYIDEVKQDTTWFLINPELFNAIHGSYLSTDGHIDDMIFVLREVVREINSR